MTGMYIVDFSEYARWKEGLSVEYNFRSKDSFLLWTRTRLAVL